MRGGGGNYALANYDYELGGAGGWMSVVVFCARKSVKSNRRRPLHIIWFYLASFQNRFLCGI